MTRIAIIGGGISGLSAAFELEKGRQAGAPLDWHLFEATDRLGGIIQTTRIACPEEEPAGEYILDGGPDSWVTEKPWARDLAVELGLGDDLIVSNDATRRTYLYLDGQLQALPDGMRLMVPDGLDALAHLTHPDTSHPLLSPAARAAYAAEPARAAALRAAALERDPHNKLDESIATFIHRHFGDEVLEKLAAPLLSGVFGGDVHKLSVRAVMPTFVQMERGHGSLVLGLEAARRNRGNRPSPPIFTSLRHGMGSLVEALVGRLPPDRLHTNTPVSELLFDTDEWNVDHKLEPDRKLRDRFGDSTSGPFTHVLLATPLDATRHLLRALDPVETTLLPGRGSFLSLTPASASSAILVTFTWPADLAATFTLPQGFGFLIPPSHTETHLLAATFADQKFPHRAPAGARIVRAFFGSDAAIHFARTPDYDTAQEALGQLAEILGPLPPPAHTTVQRWPRSLPQYEVGHLDRVAQLDSLVATLRGLTLLGNAYQGVGLPDLIRDARKAASRLIAEAKSGETTAPSAA